MLEWTLHNFNVTRNVALQWRRQTDIPTEGQIAEQLSSGIRNRRNVIQLRRVRKVL